MHICLHAVIRLWVFRDGSYDFRCRAGTAAHGKHKYRRECTKNTGNGGKADLRLMLSAAAAIPSCVSPARMACAMPRIDMRPDEHRRFTVEMGTVAGMPAASAAARERYSGDGGWQVAGHGAGRVSMWVHSQCTHPPTQMSSILAGSSFVSASVACGP